MVQCLLSGQDDFLLALFNLFGVTVGEWEIECRNNTSEGSPHSKSEEKRNI